MISSSILGISAASSIRPFSVCHRQHFKSTQQPYLPREIASAHFGSLAMTKPEPDKLGNYISKQPSYKVPLKGLEPLHLAPEASALSSELQGPKVREAT